MYTILSDTSQPLSLIRMDIEEIFYCIVFGIMIITIIAFIAFAKKRQFIRRCVVYSSISFLMVLFLFLGWICFEYPASPIAWQDAIESLVRGFILASFISIFVSVCGCLFYNFRYHETEGMGSEIKEDGTNKE